MSEHAKLAPSSAAIWVECGAYPQMQQLYPQEETQHSREGEAAHWVASSMMTTGHIPDIGDLAPNGVAVDDEMIDAASIYVLNIGVRKNADSVLHVEERIECPSISPDCWGTPDAWMYDEKQRVLHIWDFKYGHEFVDEFENWQMITYSSGILDKIGINGHTDGGVKVCMTVIQPRSYNKRGSVRTWHIRAAALRPYYNRLILAARQAEPWFINAAPVPEPQAVTNPGCEHCPGRHACPALQRSAYTAIDASLDGEPFDLTPEQTGRELEWTQKALFLLSARVAGLEESAKHMLQSGKAVPGYAMEHSEGRLKWNFSDEQIIALGDSAGVNLRVPVKAITPKQSEKSGVDFSSFSSRQKGEAKLVKVSNTDARRIFGNQ